MKNDALHRLISNMDVGELRWCEQQLRQEDGKSKDLRRKIFSKLQQQKEYDRDALLHSLKAKCSAARLGVEKHRLFEDLLEMLGRLHRNRDGNHCLWTRWHQARTMLRMGMADDAASLTFAALDTAMALCDVFAELQLRELLREIYKNADRSAMQSLILDNDQRLDTLTMNTKNLVNYTLLADRMQDYIKRHRVAEGQSVRAVIDRMMENPLMAGPQEANTLPAQLRYHTIVSLHRRLCNDLKGALNAYREVVRIWETSPARMAHQPHHYRKALANLIGMLTTAGELDEARRMLARMEKVPLRYQRDKAMHFCDVELQHLTFLLNVGAAKEAAAREPLIINGLRDYGRMIGGSYHVVFRYNLALAHVFADDPKPAMKLFTEVRRLKDCDERQDLQGLARLFLLLLLMQDADANFEHHLRNSRPHFRKGDRQHELEQTVFDWINEHWRCPTDKHRDSFVSLTAQLVAMEAIGITGAEDLRIWAEANAVNRKVHDTYLVSINENKS